MDAAIFIAALAALTTGHFFLRPRHEKAYEWVFLIAMGAIGVSLWGIIGTTLKANCS